MLIPLKGNARQSLYGDVNNDGEVTIADVNVVIDAILSTNSSASADVNNDGEVTIADVNAVIDRILNPEPNPETGTDVPGLYMGITGFNQQLYTKDITLLNRGTKNIFTGFVSSLTTKDATVLYYAVDKSLDALDAAPFPKNLSNVALITFTDGLDQGSLMLTDKGFTSDTQYASALNTRIDSMTVHGCPLQAYSIGLKGCDVTNNEMFMSNLRSLASSENNISLINDMSEIKTSFQEIADNLAKTSYSYSHRLTLTIPGVSNGTRIRFTFDNVNSNTVSLSEKYIEGTFNLSNRSLINVTYHGMTSTSGTIVMPNEVNGVYVTYTFDNLTLNDPSEKINKNGIQEWYWVSNYSKWQKNSEFTPNSIASVDVETIYTSAIVMLVLDCSSSLNSDFEMVQHAAIDFINALSNYENYNPNGHIEWGDLWYLVGSCIGDASWGNDPANVGTALIPMYTEDEDFTILNYVGYFLAGQGFKIIHQPGNWEEQWGMIDGIYVKNDIKSGNIEVPADGYYVITYDMNAETLSVEPYDGLVTVLSKVTMPGGYQDWNVGGNEMSPMSTVVENHDWIAKNVTFSDNTELKFANGTWAVNWGATTFPVGVGTQGGPNIPVEAGTYTIVFNDIMGKYGFIRVE